jgi:hypothetical protein
MRGVSGSPDQIKSHRSVLERGCGEIEHISAAMPSTVRIYYLNNFHRSIAVVLQEIE